MNRKVFVMSALSLCIGHTVTASSLIEFGKVAREGACNTMSSLFEKHPFLCGVATGVAATGAVVFVYKKVGAQPLPSSLLVGSDGASNENNGALFSGAPVPPPMPPDFNALGVLPYRRQQDGAQASAKKPVRQQGVAVDQDSVAKKETFKAIYMVVHALQAEGDHAAYWVGYQAGQDGGAGTISLNSTDAEISSVRIASLNEDKAQALEKLLKQYLASDSSSEMALKQLIGMEQGEGLTVAALVKLDPSLARQYRQE